MIWGEGSKTAVTKVTSVCFNLHLSALTPYSSACITVKLWSLCIDINANVQLFIFHICSWSKYTLHFWDEYIEHQLLQIFHRKLVYLCWNNYLVSILWMSLRCQTPREYMFHTIWCGRRFQKGLQKPIPNLMLSFVTVQFLVEHTFLS